MTSQLCVSCSHASKPLLEAAGAGHANCIVQCLKIRGRFDSSIRDDFGATAVHLAARRGRLETLRYLVEYGEAVEPLQANNGASPAHDAAATGNIACLRYLVAHTACSAHDRDNKRATPIHWAAQMGHLEVVQWLVEEAGAPLDVRTKSGVTPIHFAAAKNQLEILQYLTTLNEPNMNELVNARAGNGATPIYFAAQDGHLRCVRWLVEKTRCDCHIRANDGMTCLHAAAQDGHLDCVRYLVISGGMKAQTKSAEGATPVHYAAAQGHLHVLHWLIELGGASGVETDNYGGTPAHDAAEQGQLKALEFLYQQMVDIAMKDNDGNTPAILAERNGQNECSQFLMHAAKKQEEMRKKQEEMRKKQEDMRKKQIPEHIQPRRDHSRRGSTKSIRLQDWVEETRQEEESRQLERQGSGRSIGGQRANSPTSPLYDTEAKKQWEELQRLIAKEERQSRELGSANQRRWTEIEQLRIADAARERKKRQELEASLRTARIEVERSEKRRQEEQEFLIQKGELDLDINGPKPSAELTQQKKDEEKRRWYRQLREEEEALRKRQEEEKRQREALEKRREEERRHILEQRQQLWLQDIQRQNEEQKKTQKQEREEERRRLEGKEKKKREEDEARERKKQEDTERKRLKREEEQTRKRQKKEEKDREKAQKEREKHVKKLGKHRRQYAEKRLTDGDSACESYDHSLPENHRMGLSRSMTVSRSEQLQVKGLVKRRTKEFERRHSEILRQNRGVFKRILRSGSKHGKPKVVLARETIGEIPPAPPVPKELSSTNPSPSLTPAISTEKLPSKRASSSSSRPSSRRSSIAEFLFPSKESKEAKDSKTSTSTPKEQSRPHSVSSTPDTETPDPSRSHSRTPSLSDALTAAHAPTERREPNSSQSPAKDIRSLKDALSVHSDLEKQNSSLPRPNAPSTCDRSLSNTLKSSGQSIEKEEPRDKPGPKLKSPSLQEALASSRSSMEKLSLSPQSSLNTLDLMSMKDSSSPAAMMAALERALAVSPSQPRAAFQTSPDTSYTGGEGDKIDLMQELAKSAKMGHARHFEDSEPEALQGNEPANVPPISSPGGPPALETELDSAYHTVPAPPMIPVISGTGTGSGRLSTLETIEEDEEPEEVQEKDEHDNKKYAQIIDGFSAKRSKVLLSRVLEVWLDVRNKGLSIKAVLRSAEDANRRRLMQRTFTAWCKYCGVVDETKGRHEAHRANVALALNETTFLDWLNTQLAQINQKVENLETSIASGVPVLLALQVASGVTVPKHVAKPRYRVQFQDNWATVINFMRKLGIPTVGLNSEDLYGQKQNAVHKMLANIVSWSQTSR